MQVTSCLRCVLQLSGEQGSLQTPVPTCSQLGDTERFYVLIPPTSAGGSRQDRQTVALAQEDQHCLEKRGALGTAPPALLSATAAWAAASAAALHNPLGAGRTVGMGRVAPWCLKGLQVLRHSMLLAFLWSSTAWYHNVLSGYCLWLPAQHWEIKLLTQAANAKLLFFVKSHLP